MVAAEGSGLGTFLCGIMVGMMRMLVITIVLERFCFATKKKGGSEQAVQVEQSQRSILTQSLVTFRRSWKTPRMDELPDGQRGAFMSAL